MENRKKGQKGQKVEQRKHGKQKKGQKGRTGRTGKTGRKRGWSGVLSPQTQCNVFACLFFPCLPYFFFSFLSFWSLLSFSYVTLLRNQTIFLVVQNIKPFFVQGVFSVVSHFRAVHLTENPTSFFHNTGHGSSVPLTGQSMSVV